MKTIIALMTSVLFIWPGFSMVDACTVFVQDNGQNHYFGSNYDWHSGMGYVMVNRRGLKKQGMPLPEDPGKPLHWQSKYGSVTFVQYGQGLPKGGMNEAGLAIEGLLLPDTAYPPPDHRPYIGSTSQFKQYLLDTCGTVNDVIEQVSRVRVATYPWAPGIHYMVADRTGDCAVIAFLNGRLVIYRGDTLPVKALTNHAYDKFAGTHQLNPQFDLGFSGGSAGRFQAAVKRLQQYRKSRSTDEDVAYAMDTLEKVSAGKYTQWRVVYDQIARVVYWRCRSEEKLRWIDLKKIDFSCQLPVTAMSVQHNVAGLANHHLVVFTPDHNRRLVYQAFGLSRDVIPLPKSMWDDVWRWPDQEACAAD